MQLAENLSRLGTETAFEVLARAAQLEAEGQDIINLGIGQPDFKTPDHIVEAAVQALRNGHHGYTPGNGILPLREAVAADLKKRHGVEVQRRQRQGMSRRWRRWRRSCCRARPRQRPWHASGKALWASCC